MNDGYSVFINAGVVVIVSPGMAGQEKSDVLDSVLFAQLVASKKYPAYAQAQKKYDEYRDVLKNGWLQKAAAWDNFTLDEQPNFNAAHWLGRRLGEYVDHTVADEVTRLLSRVAQLPGTLPAIEQLREQTCKRKESAPSSEADEVVGRVCLQVILARRGPLLSSVSLSYETRRQAISNPLGQGLSVANVVGNLQSRCFQANLSKGLYDPLRGAIVQKLGDKPTKHVFDISDNVGRGAAL
ncbi:hypothetical protein SAMN03159443_04940 [Pseudomonas sp. NFACC15-1]|uniref:hypothetical protein n=1 Tax=unclassified Pseudomonas TaxID=196821 RepID=UPI000887767E|nr:MULTISPECIES: hypothetical protein [unclassified Pseudomonas]SDA93058.1 hypothetical protein SAMN03159443_04940 [Pseudomonas sp. NFACC15-1]SDY61283.1 hypothetical protein SAMN03159380_04394 [Pseudomonas sp. NFACC14]